MAKTTLSESNSPQELLLYLKEIINLHQYIKKFLSEIHQHLTVNLTASEFKLLHSIVLKLEQSEQTVSQSFSCLETANQIFDSLATEQETTPSSAAVKEAMKQLDTLLKKRDLQQKIDGELQTFFNTDFYLHRDLEQFISVITPIRKHFRVFSQKANTLGLHESIDKIAEVLNQSYQIEAQFIKIRLDIHMEQISLNIWATVEIKKELYMRLLTHYDAILNVFSALKLNDLEKETYIAHLHTGFELCFDTRFLTLMTHSARLFYSDDAAKLKQITTYADQSLAGIDLTRPLLRKKRERLEANEIVVDQQELPPNAKKRSEIELESTSDAGPTNSLLAHSFINIIAPTLKEGAHPSRRFAAAMFQALGASVWSISGLKRSIKFTMHYDLLRHGLDLCPEDDARLLKSPTERLNKLSRGNERMFNDYKKFSAVHIQAKPGAHLTLEGFQKILSDIITQLTVYTQPDHLNDLIESLLENWKGTLIADGFVNVLYVERMMNAIQGRSPVPRTMQPSHARTEFKSLTEAICHANPSEFDDYLTQLKSRIDAPEHYLNYLVNKNKSGNTPLHTALASGSFMNMETYLLEVKKMYGDQTHLFQNFLTSQNKTGFTFLHQVVSIGNMNLLKKFTAFLKAELGDHGYTLALRIKTAQHYRPFCNEQIPDYRTINAFLDTEGAKYPMPRERLERRDNSATRASSSPPRTGRIERDGFFASPSSHSHPSVHWSTEPGDRYKRY
ncbi:hypothetical protein [uncultured Legionella sp.]|uniref:hypothetical protein n=1 Tax=uncultured Legionella sp. TaxID=210934 RepID=UPI002616466B|nr:hypothetical protein [uncultured Legionella sp.]